MRCSEHHPNSWWPQDKQCDKLAGHRGRHVYQTQTMYGPDPSEFTFWDAKGSVTYLEHKVRKAFMAEIELRESLLPA